MQVQIMQQNAQQILGVVKETFADQSFDRWTGTLDCKDEQSNGDVMSCMWSKVTNILNVQSPPNSAEALRTLTAVSLIMSRKPAQEEI